MHEARVRRFLTRLTSGDGADDLAQETFIKAWRMRTAWRGDGDYGAWLMRIAWTSFVSAHRAKGRRQARDHAAYERGFEGSGLSADASIDLARALAGLDDRERAAAQLCFAEGYTHQEAARILSLPLGTLKSIAARARTQLAAALETAHG
jgi:RNA polymerase sigma factor (sigma-70 family)